MNITINKTTMISAINDVLRAVSNKDLIPILRGIKIVADDMGLTLTASNTDISVVSYIDLSEAHGLTTEEEGSIVLSANFFAGIVKRLPGDKVQLKTDGLKANLSAGKANFDVNGQSADNFPRLPEIDEADKLTISAPQLIDVIHETQKAASTQETRPILTGIHLRLGQRQLQAVATDSHRLAQRVIAIDSDVEADVIIPAKTMIEVSRMMDRFNSVELQFTPSQVVFNFGEVILYSRLLDGQYPDTNRLIPESSTTQLTVNVKALADVINRASLLSHEARSNVVQLSAGPQESVVSSQSSDVGQVAEQIEVTDFQGEPLTISFNPDFLNDALSVLPNEQQVKLSFNGDLKPFTIVPVDQTDNAQIQLVTPVRTF